MHHTVRAAVLLLLFALLGVGSPHAVAEDPPQRPPPAEAVAADAIAAFDAKDEARLAALAKPIRPAPWSVVDQLLLGKRADVARAFAKVTTDADQEALAAYVEAWADKPEQPEARAAVEAANAAFAKQDLEGGVRALEGVKGEGLPGLWVLNGRAIALRLLQRHREAEAAALAAGEHALALGWRALAVRCFQRVVQFLAWRAGWREQAEVWKKLAAIYETTGDTVALAAARVDGGSALEYAGDHDGAVASYEQGIALARTCGRRDYAANGLVNLGRLLNRRGDPTRARELLEEGLALQKAVGNRGYAGRALAGLAEVASAEGAFAEARDLFEKALAEHEAVGDTRGAASTLEVYSRFVLRLEGAPAAEGLLARLPAQDEASTPPLARAARLMLLGSVDREMGRTEEARKRLEAAVSIYRALGNTRELGSVLLELSSLELAMGRFADALRLGQEARTLADAARDSALGPAALTAMANAYARLGVLDRALELHLQVLAEARLGGRQDKLLQALANVGFSYLSRSEFAPALEHTLSGIDLAKRIGAERMLTELESNLGGIYLTIGDTDRAEELLRRVLAAEEVRGDPARLAAAKINLGALLVKTEREDEGRELLQAGMALARGAGARLWEMNALGNMAGSALNADRYEEALPLYRQALALAEALEASNEVAYLRSEIGYILGQLGRAEEGLAEVVAVSDAARESRDLGGIAYTALRRAQVLAHLGREEETLAAVREASEAYAKTTQGIPTTAAVKGDAFWWGLTSTGLEIALARGSGEVAFEFIEGSRAGQLLAGLGGRGRVTESLATEDARKGETERRVALLLAQRELASATRRGDLRKRREARAAVDAAYAAWLRAIGRIELEASRANVVVTPPRPELAAFAASLAPEEAYVAYAGTRERVLALVVTREASRLVDLGAREVIAPLLERVQPKDRAALDEALIEEARTGLWAPLALPAACRHVLVSPETGTSFVPWPVLAGSRTVSLVPSAGVIGTMRSETRAVGEGVLALGDPAYGTRPPPPWAPSGLRGASLAPLPATRDEVKAVGDIVLLGAQANETALREALAARPRWHAVHLACHGLADEHQPLRGALAVTPDAREDGFLTVAEIYRSRVPADLVVLSACESARGRETTAAGTVGFPSAFLLAGADRVLASLWKVDDEATRALMVRFYELWRPREATAKPLPPAEALQRAQAYVRDHPQHPEWKHPRYWAAWVLWGLP